MAEPENDVPEGDAPPARRADGTFLPGHSTSTGRQPGAKNRIGRTLRNHIMDAAERHGRDGQGRGGAQGYFDYLAAERPKEFAAHVAKLVPAADEEDAEIVPGIEVVEVLAVPANHFFMSDVTQLCHPDPWLYSSGEVAQLEEIRRVARERAEKAARDKAAQEAKATGKVVSIRRGSVA